MKKHTDLDGVKQVASALLFTDIEKTKYSPMVVQHPFTNTGVTAISVEGSFQFLNLFGKSKGSGYVEAEYAAADSQCRNAISNLQPD